VEDLFAVAENEICTQRKVERRQRLKTLTGLQVLFENILYVSSTTAPFLLVNVYTLPFWLLLLLI
jgi:hypothetical protein